MACQCQHRTSHVLGLRPSMCGRISPRTAPAQLPHSAAGARATRCSPTPVLAFFFPPLASCNSSSSGGPRSSAASPSSGLAAGCCACADAATTASSLALYSAVFAASWRRQTPVSARSNPRFSTCSRGGLKA
eukprot:3372784-Rhodomonas_salina.2